MLMRCTQPRPQRWQSSASSDSTGRIPPPFHNDGSGSAASDATGHRLLPLPTTPAKALPPPMLMALALQPRPPTMAKVPLPPIPQAEIPPPLPTMTALFAAADSTGLGLLPPPTTLAKALPPPMLMALALQPRHTTMAKFRFLRFHSRNTTATSNNDGSGPPQQIQQAIELLPPPTTPAKALPPPMLTALALQPRPPTMARFRFLRFHRQNTTATSNNDGSGRRSRFNRP